MDILGGKDKKFNPRAKLHDKPYVSNIWILKKE